MGSDVPLGEEEERYAVRLFDDSEVVFSAETTNPTLMLGSSTVSSLGLDAPDCVFDVEVAQISLAVGEGLPARKTVNLP